MSNETVTIYLNTPLAVTQDKPNAQDGATVIKGKILKETAMGPVVQVKTMGHVRLMNDKVPFHKILIPLQKIDFMVLE